MAREPIPLKSLEAVVPGVVFPLLGLWLGGTNWPDRGIAFAANLAPLLALMLLARFGGRRVPAMQGAATFAYGLLALGWVGRQWNVAGLTWLGAHVGLLTPLVAAGVALVLHAAITAGVRIAGVEGAG